MLRKSTAHKVRMLSPIWIVPLVALVIAVWLAVKANMERGTIVTIHFENATGITPGQTQIRLNDVQVGVVNLVKLRDDLRAVKVYAEIDRDVSKHLSVNTRFWLVTPRISATGVSNLGTLINGVFIVMDPGKPGRTQLEFKALSETPAFKSNELGTEYVLKAEELGSLDIGSPVYYRQIRVGEITGYKLSQNRRNVDVNIFVRAPHDELVQTRSRFWNVSGFGVTIGAEGMKARMASLASLINGGVAFDNAAGFEEVQIASRGHEFYLYADRESVLEGQFSIKYYYLMRFSDSVRGLTVGAPVEFRGIKVGEVVDVSLDSSANIDKSLHVYIALEPQRLDPDTKPTRDEVDKRMEAMVAQGLRGQLKMSSLVTGSRYIDLGFIAGKNTPAGEFNRLELYSEIPTLDEAADNLTRQVSSILDKVNRIPFEKIGSDLQASLGHLNKILATLDKKDTASKLDKSTAELHKALKGANTALSQIDETMRTVEQSIAPDSELRHEVTDSMKSISEAARSLKLFLDELNRHPNSLISGAKKDE